MITLNNFLTADLTSIPDPFENLDKDKEVKIGNKMIVGEEIPKVYRHIGIPKFK